jgi:Tfp pilus assembly protein PilO
MSTNQNDGVPVKTWFHNNQTLVYFLVAQTIALLGGAAYGLSYMVTLETRVATLETRGSPHLSVIDNRLTVLEKATENNKQSVDRVVEIMLRELPLKKDGTGR